MIPECLNTSGRGNCREIIIDSQVPLTFALPLYGYVMPAIVAITIATNSFIVVALSHRYLRTPTNYVLLAMAVTELLTGLSCLPWLLYYYTFNDHNQGLPAFWCVIFPYCASILPSIFHTAAIWLTVYLAVQRYIYICVPKMVQNHCTISRSKQVIVTIFIAAVWIYAPELFATYNQSVELHSIHLNHTKRVCLRMRTAFIELVGNNFYYYSIYGLHTVFAHTLPCILLVIFTWKLISAIRVADKRHACLIANKAQPPRKYTLETPSIPSEYNSDNHFINMGKRRSSASESKRVQGLKQNTRMLIVVILLFLVTEIPAAMIFSIHVSAVAFRISFIQRHYEILNKLLIVRNVLIVVTYPFRFAIYCGMSQQFREVVRKMLTQKAIFPCSQRPIHELMRPTKNGHYACRASLISGGNCNHVTTVLNDTVTPSTQLSAMEDKSRHIDGWDSGNHYQGDAEAPAEHKRSIKDSLMQSVQIGQAPAAAMEIREQTSEASDHI
ncbi:7 transmembrane receptor (rhodopsin family) domain-containing protein [Ditylenchus destructor]|nr:7 transmembrane receptor (rhodopsin family) domain-containing protein [Ditylenchus destructor]